MDGRFGFLRRTAVAAAVAWLFLGAAAGKERPEPAGAAGEVREYVYKQTPQGELRMSVHFPKDWKAGDRRPTIVFFFGGGWRSGSPEQFRPQAEYLASRGMVAARADYRVWNRHKTLPDKAVADARSAMRWVRQQAAALGIDADRIVAAGGSAGGHLAAATAFLEGFDTEDEDARVSPRPNALVLFNPVVDLRNLGTEERRELGAELRQRISPILFVGKGAPPAVLFYGTEDRFIEQGRAFAKQSVELSNRAELYSAPGMPHGFFNRSPWREATLRQADAFLRSIGYLEGEATMEAPGEKAVLVKE